MALRPSFKKHSVIPGFGLSLGFTVFYLSIIVIIPLIGLIVKTSEMSLPEFWNQISDKRVIHSFEVTFGISFLAALINLFFGFIVAWVLVRYNFPGKKLVDAFVDLPFAMPTAVSGIALASLYSQNGWIGQYLTQIGIEVAYTPLGIGMALIFVGLPFVVRTLEPVLEDFDKEMEEAAASLGANRWQVFYKVILPQLVPPMLTGFAMAFARALGEYGSVIFIAGNIPYKTEIVSLIIYMKLEQYDYAGATAVALVSLIISFVMLLIINMLQKWNRSKRSK